MINMLLVFTVIFEPVFDTDKKVCLYINKVIKFLFFIFPQTQENVLNNIIWSTGSITVKIRGKVEQFIVIKKIDLVKGNRISVIKLL